MKILLHRIYKNRYTKHCRILALLIFSLIFTLLLPKIIWNMYDDRMFTNDIPMNINVNTYEAKETSLQERLTSIASELGKGTEIIPFHINRKTKNNEKQLCKWANKELKKLKKYGIYCFYDRFTIDENNLWDCQRYNVIAEYSNKIWVLSWIIEGDNLPDEDFENQDKFCKLTVTMDYDTHKILSIKFNCDLSYKQAYINYFGWDKKRQGIDCTELVRNWNEYILNRKYNKEINDEDIDGTSDYIEDYGYENQINFLDECNLDVSIYTIATDERVYGSIGYNAFENISEQIEM